MRLTLVFATATGIGLLMGSGAALAAGGGSVYLTQTGNGQQAAIDQSYGTGDRVGSSTSPFLQKDGAGSGSNILRIDQNATTGSEFANLPSYSAAGSGNVATGFQSGTANNAEIDQEGSNSTVNLEQKGAHNGAVGAGVSGDPWSNSPYGNAIVQDYTANYSAIDLKQTSNAGTAKGNTFSVGQGGYNNHITATATSASVNGARPSNELWIRQGTTGPDLLVPGWWAINPFSPTVTSNSLSTLSNSTITVTQNGGGADAINYAALGQGGGSGNKMTVTQANGNNNLDANQIGSSNIFKSTQTNTGGGNWTASNWNFVGGEGGWPAGYANPLAGGDPGPIMQIGTGNEYYSTQSGTNLWAFGSQIGDGNFLSNTQSGDQNTLYTAQNGSYNTIYNVQAGSLNADTVSQSHSGSYSSVNQNGAGNTATIAQ